MHDISRWNFADTYFVNSRGMKRRPSVVKNRITILVALFLGLAGLAVSSSAAAPVGTMKAYSVPTTVTRDCSRDVTGVLNQVIAKLPTNSLLKFPSNGCYQVDGTININNKHGLILDGGDSSFRAMTSGLALPRLEARSRDQFRVSGSNNVTIRNAVAYGANPHAGMGDAAYVPALEAQHGFDISSSTFVTLDHVQAYNVYGDFVYIGGTSTPSRYVTVKDSQFRANGRMGISVNNARDVWIYNNVLDDMRRSVFDLEPYASTWVIERVTIQHNTIGAARLNFVASYGTCAVVDNIAILQNRLIGQEMMSEVINNAPHCSIRRHNFTFAGNTSNKTFGSPLGAALRFAGVDGIVLANNVQPLQPRRNMHLARLTHVSLVAATGNVLPNGVGTILASDGATAFCYSNNRIGAPLTTEHTTRPCR